MKGKMLLVGLLAMTLLLVWECAEKEEEPTIVGPVYTTPPTQPVDADLEHYAGNIASFVEVSDEMDTLLYDLENYLTSGEATAEEVDARIEEIATLNDSRTVFLDSLIATELLLEQAFAPDIGTLGLFSSIAKGIYNAAKATVVNTGRMIRSGYQVLSGQRTLTEVLRDPNSGIPIVSSFAEKLAKHNQQRDEAIIRAIQEGDTHEGNCDWTQIPGSTAEEKIANYRNMPEDDPIKKELRGNVHLWDTEEARRTVETLKEVTKEGIKTIAGGYGAGNIQTEVMTQMIEDEMTPIEEQPKGQIQVSVKEHETSNPVTDHTTLIVKRGQPENHQKIAIVVNPAPEQDYDLPPGTYDFITLSDIYIRWIEEGKTILQDVQDAFTAWMYKIEDYAIITDEIRITPPNPHPGAIAQANIDAISLYGDSLTFTWDVGGNSISSNTGRECRFIAANAGPLTISVTIQDTRGHSITKSIVVEVTAADFDVAWSISNEQIADNNANPGESFQLDVDIINTNDEVMSGTFTAECEGVPISGTGSLTLEPAEEGRVSFNVDIPVGYGEANLDVIIHFEGTVGESQLTLQNSIPLTCDFYIEIDEIPGVATERIQYITGTVANPKLELATISYGYDDNITTEPINLSNGAFNHPVILDATTDTVTYTATISASSGYREATESVQFRAHIPAASLRVTLTWNTGGNDLDLWVTDPNGEACGYSNPHTAIGGQLDTDDVDGYGPENFTLANPIPGDYFVRVHYYSTHRGEDPYGSEPYPTIPHIRIVFNEGTAEEEEYHFSHWLENTGDSWDVTTIHCDESGNLSIGGTAKFIGTFFNYANLPAK